MLPAEFIVLAICLRLLAGATYFIATWKGIAKPNPVTWLVWGLAPLVAFMAQIQTAIEPSDWISLALAFGPLCIFMVSVARGNRWRVTLFDVLCGISAMIGIVLWQITTDPVMAVIFGIVADILGGVPTLKKSFSAPDSEKAFPYFLSISSMVVVLLTLKDWSFIVYGFPLYILCINLVLFGLIASRIGVRLTGASKSQIIRSKV